MIGGDLDGPNGRNMDCPLDRHPFGRSVTVYLDSLIGRHQTVHLDRQLTYIFGQSNYMFQSRPNGRFTYVYLDGPNTRCQGVHLDG